MRFKQHELPENWSWKTMGDVAEVAGGGTPRTSDPSNYENGSIPWITPADLSGYKEKYITHGARFITEKGLQSSSAQLLPAGSVLFSSRAPVGYVAIAANPLCTNQGFKSFILRDGVLPEYVYWWLKGAKALAESFASGTTFLELSGARARQLPIPIAPRMEQKRIVMEIENSLSRLEGVEQTITSFTSRISALRHSVLARAFRG